MSESRQLTPNEIKRMTLKSQARSEARRAPWSPKKVAAAATAGTALVATTVLLATGMRGNNNSAPSAAPEGQTGNVPAATMDYLKSRPTKEATVPTGGGIDNAAYAVDGARLDQSADIKAGIEAMLNTEVKQDTGGTIPQAGEKLDVPNIPPVDQIPPEAR